MTHTGYQWQQDRLVLHLYIQPKSRMTGYDGLHDRYIRFRVAAPATEGKANRNLIELLSDVFGVARGNIEMLRGFESRYKTVAISRPQKLPEWIARP